jgi:hypothetical protein
MHHAASPRSRERTSAGAERRASPVRAAMNASAATA